MWNFEQGRCSREHRLCNLIVRPNLRVAPPISVKFCPVPWPAVVRPARPSGTRPPTKRTTAEGTALQARKCQASFEPSNRLLCRWQRGLRPESKYGGVEILQTTSAKSDPPAMTGRTLASGSEISPCEATAEARAQVFAQPLDQRVSICGAVRPALFEFDDAPAYLPIGCRHQRIYSARSHMTRVQRFEGFGE